MARKLIDISVPLQNDVPADPPGGHPTIQYIDHQQGLPRMLQFFDGLKAEDLPDGQGWAVEQVQLSTHNGTHLDAPWHFHPTMNRGERSWTIDEVPLDWCLQPGVKLELPHLRIDDREFQDRMAEEDDVRLAGIRDRAADAVEQDVPVLHLARREVGVVLVPAPVAVEPDLRDVIPAAQPPDREQRDDEPERAEHHGEVSSESAARQPVGKGRCVGIGRLMDHHDLRTGNTGTASRRPRSG